MRSRSSTGTATQVRPCGGSGRVVGGWSQRQDGEIAYRLLEDVGTDAEAAVAFEAESLADWLGDVRITPRFRTPLERELAA